MGREVSISIGVPDSLREANEAEGLDPMQDCYCVNFTEDGGSGGFTAQSPCLCTLKLATEMWLEGRSVTEVQDAMGRPHEDEEE